MEKNVKKFENFGLKGKALEGFRSYLSDRSQASASYGSVAARALAADASREDSDGFTLVGPRQRRSRPPVVIGTKTSNALSGVPLQSNVLVFRLSKGTKAKAIQDYCANNGVVVREIEKKSAESYSLESFRIVVDREHEEKVLSPDFWPSTVAVRKWIIYRHRTQSIVRAGPVIQAASENG